MIVRAVEFQRNAAGSPKSTADVIVKPNLILGCNQGTAILCRKHDVIEKIGVRVGHQTTLPCLSSKGFAGCRPLRGLQIVASVVLGLTPQALCCLYRVLKNNGSVCWQVGNFVHKGEVFPRDILFYDIFKLFGFTLRNRIIWHYRHGLHSQKKFSGRYETILWFTKTDKYIFNLDAVRIPALYPGKTHYKGPRLGQPSGKPRGKNPSDVWEIISEDWNSSFWDIPNVKANHPEKTIQPCQFPVELVERCVLALTRKGDRVLDPYAGVGSTLIAAARHGRRALGSEKESKYYKLALHRLAALRAGTLKLRPLGKPVHTPNGNVSKIPDEWRTRRATLFSPLIHS